MKKILVLGAGRSSSVLISYLLDHAQEWNAMITVSDYSAAHAEAKTRGHVRASAIAFDAHNDMLRRQTISANDIVISMLPPQLHILVAKDCIECRKHLVTASYVSKEMQALSSDVKRAGLLFMCEIGLDPGIDHMSAMKVIHRIQQEGGSITGFKSGTGGLVAPESDNNPWHYKVTWNPRNVVLAGQGTAQYLDHGEKKYVPYHRLFTTTEKFKIDGYGKFEAYPNRDSLQYISQYGLQDIQTIIRSTLRKEGYCEAWNALVNLGLTDDSYTIENACVLSYAQWLISYLPDRKHHVEKKKLHTVKERTAKFLECGKNSEVIQLLEWLGLMSDEKIPLEKASPAQIIQELIERKWVMRAEDNDLVVMRHEFHYLKEAQPHCCVSTLALTGDDAINTAMAKTVGLPMAIMVKLLLDHDLFLTGVHIPVMSQVYEPVLKDLEELGIRFKEEMKDLKQQ